MVRKQRLYVEQSVAGVFNRNASAEGCGACFLALAGWDGHSLHQ